MRPTIDEIAYLDENFTLRIPVLEDLRKRIEASMDIADDKQPVI
jgi:hypothetical protein